MELEQYMQRLFGQVELHLTKMKGKEHQCIQPFVIANNSIVIIREVFDMYTKGQLGLQGPPLGGEEIRSRFKYIIRDLVFIPMMSTFEYYTIKLAQNSPGSPADSFIKARGERSVHLSQLVPLIAELERGKEVWNFAIALRNDLVHFAGYARQTLPSPLSDFPIHMVEGQESEAVLRSYISLLCDLEESFFSFVQSACSNDCD